MSDSLQPHGLKHARLPCPSPSLRVCSNSCPLSQWCHSTISSSVVPFSSCLQSCTSLGTDGLYPVSMRGWDSIFSIPIQLICQKEPGSRWLGSFLAHPLPMTPFVSYDKSSGTLGDFVPVSHHLHACITDRLSLVFWPLLIFLMSIEWRPMQKSGKHIHILFVSGVCLCLWSFKTVVLAHTSFLNFSKNFACCLNICLDGW